MSRRLLCLYFPSLALDRLQREDSARRLRAFAVTREEKAHLYIGAANDLATQAGIVVGARLSDSLTILPTLDAVPDDLEANARVKQRLIRWCGRYSPLVADDGFGGIAIDITGCVHLFGGEASLLKDVQARIRRTGYRVRGAIADSLGAAWALARYAKRVIVPRNELPDALGPLPIEGLRLAEETVRELRRLGIGTIVELRKMPRAPLATRYGKTILLRLDQAFCDAEEAIAPYYPSAPYRAGRTLPEPIGTVDAVQYLLEGLLKELCSQLEKANTGARLLDLDCYRVDGTVARCSIATSKPVRSIAHLLRLFSEKLDSIDAGFGIETLVLSASQTDKLDPAQLCFPQLDREQEIETALDILIDRLGIRLGLEEVCRFHICESLLPEYALEFRPVSAPETTSAVWREGRLRPVRLIKPPIRIEVATLHPGDLPVQFRIGHQLHRIVRAEGPERLTPEWWRDQATRWERRDYYRIENDQGARFWIFRELRSVSRSAHASQWFLCGHLM